MRKLFLAGAASLTLIFGTAPLAAQTAGAGAAAAQAAMTPQQKAAYDAWPADRKSAYDGWPAEYQAYYWSLSSNQQTGWWVLTPEQRTQIMGMDAAQRTAAWVSIEAQLKGAPPEAATATESASPAQPPVEQVQANPRGEGPASPIPPNPATAGDPVPPAQPSDPTYQAGPYKGALTAPPAEAMNKTYPVCTRTVQDNCRNPGGK